MRMRFALVICVLSFAVSAVADPPKKEEPKAARSVAELRQQIEQILKDTHTPAVSVAIVHKDGPEWVGALGTANVAANEAATADTLFRIGSTSKAFASLSILKLAREGKLSLEDPVRKLAPDVEFKNRWESTDPVRVVNLLEHTTGWDDMHLREYAKNADGMDLRTALAYGTASRVSRWRPGTRMSYCNTGPAVAAYIVEKVTGQRFEDYVQQNFFGPMGMKTATYFLSAAHAVTLYHDDGKTPYPYWHIIYRPAGSINASANDMAPYVQFYLNRGAVNGVQLVAAEDIDRMESPVSTWAAKDGLKAGYGLSNYWTFSDGFVYHGHNGGVEGGLTELGYMSEYGVGYFFSISSGNGGAFDRISKAIRKYVTLTLAKPVVPAPAAMPSFVADYAGWYEPDSPRQELTHFLERIAGLTHVSFADGKMTLKGMNGPSNFAPVGGRFFRYLPKEGSPEPAASAALITPNADGTFIYAGNVLKRVPTVVALAEIALTGFVALAVVSIPIYAVFWMIGGFIPRRRRPAERAMRIYPLIAVASLVAFCGIFVVSSGEILTRLGNVSVWSVALMVTTLLFAGAVLMSSWAVITAGAGVRRWVRWYSGVVALALMIAVVYLAWWGIIGLRTWA
ncbi:MAG TPA: serine hydrolase domain-containing protein [Terracidiphilus sp.]